MKKTIILAAIFVLGFLLRVYHINSWGIWNDEQASVLIAKGETRYFIRDGKFTDTDLSRFSNKERHAKNTLSNVYTATINDNGNSIAYNVLLHYWLDIFGVSDLSTRLLALIFGLLIIPLAYRFGLEVFKNENAALVTAFLFAIHPLFIEYSIMCRAYTMGSFFTLLSTLFFYRIITGRGDTKTYPLYAMAVSLSLLTHYLTSYVFIAQGIVFLLYVRDRSIWAKYILAGIFILLVFGTWMKVAGINGFKVLKLQNAHNLVQASKYKTGDTGEAAFILPPTPKNIITGYMEVWLQIFQNQLEYLDFRVRKLVILLLLPFSLIGLMIWQKRKDPAQMKIIYILLVMTFTQTLYATVDAIRAGHCKSFHPLYANFAVPYGIMLLGYAIYSCFEYRLLRVYTIVVSMAILVINGFSFLPTYGNLRGIYPAENFHRISAEEIVRKYQKSDTVSIKSSIDAKLINLYLPDNIDIEQKIDTNITGLYLMPNRN
jgi:uncharacterized membrane protein